MPVLVEKSTTIRILADDLTGACDSAAAFLAAGHQVRVWLAAVATHPTEESVQAFNTNTRNLPPEAAARAIAEAAETLPPALLFKKVDSAGRGPIAAELLALQRTLGTAAILFAPSFPGAGRIVQHGILFVDEAEPMPLVALLEDEVATAQISHPSQITRALAAGGKILVCDAVAQADLEALAAVDHPNLLYAGSAGLAHALASRNEHPHPTLPRPMPSVALALTICGTPHPVALRQLKHIAEAHPTHPRLEIQAEAADAPAILEAFARYDPEALILTGGDTAHLVLTTLGAKSILLQGELAPGIPWGILQGGLADNRIVITKFGGFGAPDSLTRIVTGLL